VGVGMCSHAEVARNREYLVSSGEVSRRQCGRRFSPTAFLPNQQTSEVLDWLTNLLTEFLQEFPCDGIIFFALKSRNCVTGVTHCTFARRLALWECRLQSDLAHTPTFFISGSIPP
jgi:hypothetical protein